jgi:hypothetical protein
VAVEPLDTSNAAGSDVLQGRASLLASPERAGSAGASSYRIGSVTAARSITGSACPRALSPRAVSLSQAEYSKLDAYLEERALPPERKNTMKSQIRGKARRNGPIYRFKLTDGLGAKIEGYSSRYRVVFRSAHGIEDGFRIRITEFLRSLGLGNLIVRPATHLDNRPGRSGSGG